MCQRRIYAAADIGSNTIHLIAAEITPEEKVSVLFRKSSLIRLLEISGGYSNRISVEKIEESVGIINSMKEALVQYNAEFRIVATGAVRQAENSAEYLEILKNRCGVLVEVLSAEREAELTFKGILKYYRPGDTKILAVDLGGGSAEFICGNENQIDIITSVNCGAVRLAKQHFPDFVLNEERINAAASGIKILLKPVVHELKLIRQSEMIISSGTAYTLFNIYNAVHNREKDFKSGAMTVPEFELILNRILSARTPEDRSQIAGMDPRRADIFPAGMMFYKILIDLLNITAIQYSDYSLREGVLFEMAEKNK